MNIARSLLKHIVSGVAVCKKRILVLNGDHVLFYQDLVIIFTVNLDVVCAKINTKYVVSHYSATFLVVISKILEIVRFFEAEVFIVTDNNVV